MSVVPGSTTEGQDSDFWEFVACGRCHLPFTPEPGAQPTIPFWITECGHVVCNNHLKPNQTCAKCGAQNIEVAPLQREMSAPMSEWFASLPQAFDAVAFATRFQFETMASLVRYYRRKYAQHRQVMERSKADMEQLRRTVEDLRAENEQLRTYTIAPSDVPNGNGKRRMLDSHRHASGALTNSSPMSVAMGLSTNRLTLPPSHQQPAFTPRKQPSDNGAGMDAQGQRPGSRRLEQYAYEPRMQQRMANTAQMSYAQAAPIRHELSRQHSGESVQDNAHIPTMQPPPAAGISSQRAALGFRPAGQQPHPVRRIGNPNGPRTMPPPVSSARLQPSGTFRPPPTPNGHRMAQVESSHTRQLPRPPPAYNGMSSGDSFQSNRFSSATSVPNQRFVPPPPSGIQRFSTPAPVAGPSHSGLMRTNTDLGPRSVMPGQRMPFVPDGHR